MMMLPLLICTVLIVPISVRSETKGVEARKEVSRGEELLRRGLDWIGERSFGAVGPIVPDVRDGPVDSVEGRKHKKIKMNKYLFPLIIGFLLIKSVILPLTLKALAILSGKAVVLSLMSLILAAIVGLKSVASGGGSPAQSKIDLVNLPVHKYRRKDIMPDWSSQDDEEPPYRYYPERRRR